MLEGCRSYQMKDTSSIMPATMYQQVADHRSGFRARSMALQRGGRKGRGRVVNVREYVVLVGRLVFTCALRVHV